MTLIQTLSDGTKFYVQTTNLAGVDYRLYFEFSDYQSVWRLTICDTADSVLLAGLVLNIGVKLNLGFGVRPDLPQGSFAVISTSGDSSPGLGELGVNQRCVLVFFECE